MTMPDPASTTRPTEVELLPCPFCGGPATAWEEDENGLCPAVWCQNSVSCGGEVSIAEEKIDARAAWNNRTASTPRAQVEASEWLPITDAQLDGSEYVVWAVCGETEQGWPTIAAFDTRKRWISIDDGLVAPTLYMPLDRIPAPAIERGEYREGDRK